MITIASLTATAWHDVRSWDGPPSFAILIVLLLTALLLVAVVRVGRGPRRGALELVAQRYARGDIDEEEYRRRTSELRSKGS